VTRKLYELTQAGKLDEARQVQYALVKLFDAMILGPEFPDGFRLGASLRGFHMGQGRQPSTRAQRNDLEDLSSTLQGLLTEQGCGNEPAMGCQGSGDGSGVDSADVTELVETILGELKRRGVALV